MTLRDYLDSQILQLIDNKLVGTNVSLEEFLEEALLAKLAAPSHRTLRIETLLRIWDTAEKYGDDLEFKKKFFNYHLA